MHCPTACFSKIAIGQSCAITCALGTQPRSVAVDKMASIFAKHIWQP